MRCCLSKMVLLHGSLLHLISHKSLMTGFYLGLIFSLVPLLPRQLILMPRLTDPMTTLTSQKLARITYHAPYTGQAMQREIVEYSIEEFRVGQIRSQRLLISIVMQTANELACLPNEHL